MEKFIECVAFDYIKYLEDYIISNTNEVSNLNLYIDFLKSKVLKGQEDE